MSHRHPPWASRVFGGLPRAFWGLWVGTIINRLGLRGRVLKGCVFGAPVREFIWLSLIGCPATTAERFALCKGRPAKLSTLYGGQTGKTSPANADARRCHGGLRRGSLSVADSGVITRGRSSVIDAEVSDERDRVAVGIADGGQPHTFVDRLYRSWGQAPLGDIGDVAVQVVHSEVHQG